MSRLRTVSLVLASSTAAALCCCGGSRTAEEPDPAFRKGVYEGEATTPAGRGVFASLLLRGDGTGLMLVDAFGGYLDGPVDVVMDCESSLTVSLADDGGSGLLCSTAVRLDTLAGVISGPYGEFGPTAPVRLVFTTDTLPTDGEFLSACSFVPPGFTVPGGFETEWCTVRMLSVDDSVRDYEAVMSSAERLRDLSGGTWPPRGMTLEEDVIDLVMHQAEHEARQAFAYAVVSPEGDRVLGRIHVMPALPGTGADAAVRLWLRRDLGEDGGEERILPIVVEWITEEWPFGRVVYPGRETDQ